MTAIMRPIDPGGPRPAPVEPRRQQSADEATSPCEVCSPIPTMPSTSSGTAMPTVAPGAGHVMLGGVAEKGRRWSHWVSAGAEPVRYRDGIAYRAVCGAACVPADSGYLAELPACPVCDEREHAFSRRAAPQCCTVDRSSG